MKLEKIHIENFKSFEKIDATINERLNLLIGKNNSGKSNLIQGILFLRDIVLNDYNIRLFEENIHAKDTMRSVKFIILFSISEYERSEIISQLPLIEPLKTEILKDLKNKLKYTISINNEKIIDEDISLFLDEQEITFAIRDESNRYSLIDLPSLSRTSDGYKWIMKPDVQLDYRGSLVRRAWSMHWRDPAEYSSNLLYNFFKHIYYLNANRFSEEIKPYEGNYELKDDASNLPEVLSTIANSNKRLYTKIMNDVKIIADDIEEINTPPINMPKEGKQDIRIVIEEKHYPSVNYSWSNISSGTKEIIFEITQLNLSSDGSLLIIEEPEIHLHASAVKKFVDMLKTRAKEHDEQIIITSHSPIFIDKLRPENMLFVTKSKGKSVIHSLSGELEMHKMFQEDGLSFGDIISSQFTLFILIVEGSDDYKIYRAFLDKAGIPPRKVAIANPEENGGVDKAIQYGLFLKKLQLGIPFMLLLDSDSPKMKKEHLKKIKDAGFKPDEYYVLNEKEIEDYLIDPKALSSFLNEKSISKVQKAIEGTKGKGKEKLEKIIKILCGEKIKDKHMIVRHFEEIPDEINEIIVRIKKLAKIE